MFKIIFGILASSMIVLMLTFGAVLGAGDDSNKGTDCSSRGHGNIGYGYGCVGYGSGENH